MDLYIGRKQLDPLETYVPVVLAAKDQLAQAGEICGGWRGTVPGRTWLWATRCPPAPSNLARLCWGADPTPPEIARSPPPPPPPPPPK
jgi:hypothetical protein